MNNHMLVKYVYFNNQPIGTVVALSPYEIGWSQCCSKDIFSKRRGKEIAIGRAKMGTNSKPRKYKINGQMVDLIHDEFLLISERATRYFKQEKCTDESNENAEK